MNYFSLNNKKCSCGKEHFVNEIDIISEKFALKKIPSLMKKYNTKKAFILADKNTFEVAGKKVIEILDAENIPHSEHIFKTTHLEPDEFAVGSAVMHFDYSCDVIIGVGSGVINDIAKILSTFSKLTYFIVATAPSMDGYASSLSSMVMDSVKFSIPSRCADAIIGDIDILKNAPIKMLKSGLGDIIAKYISLCEWKIANLILGEYYCETIASIVRDALKRCVDTAKDLLNRDEEAVKSVFEALIISGIAMAYAGCSRPASGVEHYFSHIWDMRALAFNTPMDFHGIQCAIGTLLAAKIYKQIKVKVPDKEKALAYAKKFSYSDWSETFSEFLGEGSSAMIELEKKEQKYDTEKHSKRLDTILKNWDNILKIIEEEVPSPEYIENLLDTIDAPKFVSDIGLSDDILPMSFACTKDIRDKYILSRLAWDLGILDDLTF